MKFIKDTIQILKDTTWPSRKQRWIDFISIMEYTIFFVLVIYLFDTLLSGGLQNLFRFL